jgi:glycosyltransferase involved in cell wall biosynthesis
VQREKNGSRESRPIRTLTFTTLYPNAAQLGHGLFVETRLRHLLASGHVETRVVAPIPWFPLANTRFGRYADFAKAPVREERFGVDITHPRYPVIAKVGMNLAPALLYSATVSHVRRILSSGFDFDLIDAHYFYPDGIAAVLLARKLNKPVVITARGTDINLIPGFSLPKTMIRWAAARSDGLVTVCQALKDELVHLGVGHGRIRVLRNGVDLDMFKPVDPSAAKSQLDVGTPTIASVGHLITRKRHDLVIRALQAMPAASLLIAGAGPEEERLRTLAADLGVASRVRFLGLVPQKDLPTVYGAADVLVLASNREGWANVLLEAMACGTPVVATNIWGTPEVVATPEAGRLVDEATPQALSTAIRELLADPPSRTATRAYAERFSWDETTQGQLQLIREVIENHRRSRKT